MVTAKIIFFVTCKTSFALYTSTHSNHQFSVEMGLAKSLWAASDQFVKSVSVCTVRDGLETVHNRLLLLLSTSIAVVQQAAQAHNVWRPRQRCWSQRQQWQCGCRYHFVPMIDRYRQGTSVLVQVPVTYQSIIHTVLHLTIPCE